MKVSIVEALFEHIEEIAPHVRQADRAELWAFACATPEQTMLRGLSVPGYVRTGLIDGVAVCMFGVSSLDKSRKLGCPWMVGTDLLEKHSGVFLRRCGNVVQEMLSDFERLENYVDARNTRAIAWLKWLGFSFGEKIPLGVKADLFIKFSLEAENGK